ncbi:MAG TPA: hypothetical protein PK060_15425 [Polaromonas sp.]|uniref:hypothetical protein n=1 Tax=unclassified Polaromonas TaxID=2638319 RepID=UPI0025F64E87|nr:MULTISPECIES: hypothetical protein [unclassified Polaromonas]HQT08602.1 hypothetical protein [Polaromonas sp.]
MNHALQRECPRTPAKHRTSTANAYAKDVRQFTETYGGSIPCSAEELISYVRLLSRRVAPPTIVRRVMALQDAHVQLGLPSPTADPRIRTALRHLTSGDLPINLLDAKKAKGEASVARKTAKVAAPITRALLIRMLDSMGTGRRSLDRRDKAIFLLGFIGRLKRGTICALNLEDLTFTPDALLLRIRPIPEPTHTGEDANIAVPVSVVESRPVAIPMTRGPLCAGTACQEWIAHNGLEGKQGPLFPRFTRSGEPVLDERLDAAYVSALVKKRLLDAGEDDVSLYSGESLRRGHDLESKTSRRR